MRDSLAAYLILWCLHISVGAEEILLLRCQSERLAFLHCRPAPCHHLRAGAIRKHQVVNPTLLNAFLQIAQLVDR